MAQNLIMQPDKKKVDIVISFKPHLIYINA